MREGDVLMDAAKITGFAPTRLLLLASIMAAAGCGGGGGGGSTPAPPVVVEPPPAPSGPDFSDVDASFQAFIDGTADFDGIS